MRTHPHLRPTDQGAVFLTGSEIPAEIKLRPGDVVRPLRLRRVARTGYRLRADDPVVQEAAAAALRSEPLTGALRTLARSVGHRELEEEIPRLQEAVRDVLARSYVRAHHFGGSERGIWMVDVAPRIPGEIQRIGDPTLTPDQLLEVWSVRRVWTGTRYAPTSRRDWFGEDDFESGGLSGARSVRIVTVTGGMEMLSGDLSPACPYRCKGGFLSPSRYFHAERCPATTADADSKEVP